jgi:putative membrane protein
MTVAQMIPLADTWGMHGDVGWGWMTLMMVGMVLFWGVVIFGIAWLIRGGFDRRPHHQSESAIDVLERRFAEGAISVEEYRTRREVLGGGIAESNGARKGERLPTPRATGRA